MTTEFQPPNNPEPLGIDLRDTQSVTGPRFVMRFTSTPRGARRARRLVSRRLHEWGHPYGTETNDTVTLIAAELTANAVRPGHVRGRDFRLVLLQKEDVLRVEVTDTRGELRPRCHNAGPNAETGRGLLLISHLATRWAVTTPTATTPAKTVWAEFATDFHS